MAPGPGGRRRGASPKQIINGIKSEGMRYVMGIVFKAYTPRLVIVAAAIIGAAVCSAKGTLFTQRLVDDYIMPLIGVENPDFGPLAAAIGSVCVIYAIGLVCSFLQNRLMVNVGQGSLRNIRSELFRHMEKLPIKYFDTHPHGEVMSVYTNDTDSMREFIGRSFPQILSSFMTIVTTFISMCILSVPLTVFAVIMTAFVMFISAKLAGISGKYFAKQQQDLAKLNGYIEEMTSGQKEIKVFTREARTFEEFKVLNDTLRESASTANGVANIIMPVTAQLGNLNYALTAVLGAICALNGKFDISIGVLISFLTLSKSFTRPFSMLATEMNSIVQAAAGAQRIWSIVREEPETDEGYVTLVNAEEAPDGTLREASERTGLWAWKHTHQADGTTDYVKLQGDVVLEDVDFGYVSNKQVLFDINMYAKPGQKVALVGSTGAGKTTIMNLLNRFYDIQDGKIRYDGININKIKKADLRRSLGIVLQETHLFSGTVMDNIRYGRQDATDEDCRRAAELVNAAGFIERLPDGYDTYLTGDGANLSQGQRQLIAIARAAVADPPALILDEATSSIDTRTEQLVQAGMDSLMKGRTTFVIAHRLSTVRNADCIMVMEKGRIIERGSHDELIAAKGRYYRLYTGLTA